MEKSLLKKRYLERISEEVAKMPQESILKILSGLDELYPTEFLAMFSQGFYGGNYTKRTTKKEVKSERLVKEIQILKDCKDLTEKKELFDEIVKKVIEEVYAEEYDTYRLPLALKTLAMYAFEFEDVHAMVELMKRRREIIGKIYNCEVERISQKDDEFDASDIYEKIIKMIVEQCDEETADKYIQEMIDGKYFKLSHVSENWGWNIWECDIVDTYKSYKFLNSLSDRAKDLLKSELL